MKKILFAVGLFLCGNVFATTDVNIVGIDTNIKISSPTFDGPVAITSTFTVTGNSYLGAGAFVSTNTYYTGAWKLPSTLSVPALTGTTSITGGAISGTTLDMTGNAHYGATGGAYISTFTASNGNQAWAGALTAASFTGVGTGLTALTAANIAAGNLIITVKPYSSSNCESLTPAAEGEWCYDTGTHKLEISTSTNVGGFEAVH